VQEWASPITDLPEHFGVGTKSPFCQAGIKSNWYPVSVNKHNVTSQRAAYNAFNEFTSKYPAFAPSVILDEGYSLQGMRAVPDESTAVADRQYDVLMQVVNI
jgi:hypothetical protein